MYKINIKERLNVKSNEMFQAAKSKLSTLLSPILPKKDNFDQRQQRFRNRKRRMIENCDEDVAVTSTLPPVKRKKSSFSASSLFKNLSVSNLFNYVMRNSPIMANNENVPSATSEDNGSETSVYTPRSSHYTSHKRVLRTPLTQLSKSRVYDLTVDDGEIDLEITKVKVDLTKDNHIDLSEDERKNKLHNETNTSKDESFNNKRNDSIIDIPRKSSKSFLTESIRLEERKRYREMVSLYTNVSLPEYSDSISPDHNKSRRDTPTFDLTVDSLSNSFCFGQSYIKSPIIDLTKNNVIKQAKHSNNVKLTRKVYSDNTNSIVINNTSNSNMTMSPYTSLRSNSFTIPSTIPVDNTSFYSNGSTNSFTNATPDDTRLSHSSNSLLDFTWINKWRETLDPLQLERERMIKEEEKKKEILKKKKLEEFEELKKKIEEQKSKEFIPLSNDMLSLVKKVLTSGNGREVFAQGFNAEITRSDLATLRESTWLNDEVVNFYFSLIKERSETSKDLPKVHVFNTFFYPKIMKMGFAGVKRWTRKIDIFAMDLILIPVHLGMHWCLAVIDFKKKQFVYYDSLRGNNMQCLMALKGYLQDESKDKKKVDYDAEDWDMIMPKDIPEQMNGCDCGVFMCKYAEYKSRQVDFTFTQSNMGYFRKRMICEIINKKLM